MTIKHKDCPQCNNRGIVRCYVFNTEQPVLPLLVPMPVRNNYSIQEKYCDCIYGSDKRRFDERTQSPDWVNPLEGLSDQQILSWMDRCHENEQAINQEFE